MYTTVFYKENTDGTFELVKAQKSGGKPRFKDAKFPYYVQEGEFDGVVDPSKGINVETEEERLGRKLKETEAALFELMTR